MSPSFDRFTGVGVLFLLLKLMLCVLSAPESVADPIADEVGQGQVRGGDPQQRDLRRRRHQRIQERGSNPDH